MNGVQQHMTAVRFNHLLHSIAPMYTCTRSRRVPQKTQYTLQVRFTWNIWFLLSESVLRGTFHFCSPGPFYTEHFNLLLQGKNTDKSTASWNNRGKFGIMEETHNKQVGCCCCCYAVSVLGLLSPQAYPNNNNQKLQTNKQKQQKTRGFFKPKYPPGIDK